MTDEPRKPTTADIALAFERLHELMLDHSPRDLAEIVMAMTAGGDDEERALIHEHNHVLCALTHDLYRAAD